jgi:hypothetical protein
MQSCYAIERKLARKSSLTSQGLPLCAPKLLSPELDSVDSLICAGTAGGP